MTDISDQAGPAPSLARFAPRHWPTWLGLGMLRLVSRLPGRARDLLGSRLGDLYYLLNAKRRQVARANIGLCFPELSAPARDRLLRAHFRVTMQSLLDLPWLWWSDPARLHERVRVTGRAHLEKERERGRGVILLTCHSVALETGGTVLSRDYPILALVKPVRNEVLGLVTQKSRERFGSRILTRDDSPRQMIRAIREGFSFYYLPDEDLGRDKDCVFAPFFGVPAATLTALGRIARLSDAAVLPCFTRRLPGGRYELRIGAPLKNFPGGDPVLDATRMNQELEKGIREMPEQYLWTFKRFKNRPDNAPSPYER